jgi:hypothetical protein
MRKQHERRVEGRRIRIKEERVMRKPQSEWRGTRKPEEGEKWDEEAAWRRKRGMGKQHDGRDERWGSRHERGKRKEEATEGVKRDEEARRGREEGWGSQKREKRGTRKPQERRGGDGMVRWKRMRDEEARRGRKEGWGSRKRGEGEMGW